MILLWQAGEHSWRQVSVVEYRLLVTGKVFCCIFKQRRCIAFEETEQNKMLKDAKTPPGHKRNGTFHVDIVIKWIVNKRVCKQLSLRSSTTDCEVCTGNTSVFVFFAARWALWRQCIREECMCMPKCVCVSLATVLSVCALTAQQVMDPQLPPIQFQPSTF